MELIIPKSGSLRRSKDLFSWFPPPPLIRSVPPTYCRESKRREAEKWWHANQQTTLARPRYFCLHPSVISFLSNSFTPACFPGCIPITTGPHNKSKPGFQRKCYPHLISKTKPMDNLETVLGASENKDLCPAAARQVTATTGFAVSICAQVHRRCRVFLHDVIIGYNYRLCPC